jgi:RNA polymerase sigma factor (sigma-70 family)
MDDLGPEAKSVELIPGSTRPDGSRRIAVDAPPGTTDQKVGGSTPSERAELVQVTGANPGGGYGQQCLMTGDPSDASIIAESMRDPQCFAAIFDRHFGALYGFVGRRAGRAVADELTADVFLAAFEGRSRYDPLRSSARPWLFGIATHLIARRYRSAERQSRAYDRARTTDQLAIDHFAEVDARVDATRDANGLAGVVDALNDDDRDVLLLFAWEGLGYDEIASALDIPVGTVKSRLHRARCIVREHLDASRAIPGRSVTTGGDL